MKKLLLLLICVFLCFESTAKEVNFNNLVKREGIWFEKFSDNPYSGDVVGKEKGKMIKGQKTGEWISFFGYKNHFRVKGNYKKGKLHGKKLEFINSTGKLFRKEIYKKGKLIESYEYHDNGEVQAHMKHINGKKFHYKYTHYYKNGQVEEKGKTHLDYDDIPLDYGVTPHYDGKYLAFHENGTLHTKQNWKKGVIVDNEVEYFCDDGTRYRKEIIVDGKINGEVIDYWCPSDFVSAIKIKDRIYSKGKYSNGKKVGLHLQFSRDGQITKEGNYKNGKKVGVHTSYFDNGEVKEINNYNNEGVRNGEKVYYHVNKKNKRFLVYKKNLIPCPNNRLIECLHGKQVSFELETGQIKSELNYKFGKIDGENKYYSDGELSYTNYHNEDGYKFEFYYKNGKIRSKGEYKNGEKIGNWVEYNELGEIIKNKQYD